MSDDLWLKLARVIGLLGLGLLIVSSIGGTLLAARTAQKIKLLKGQTFKYHRALSLIGATLFLLHPIPLVLAHATTGMLWQNVLVPFTAPKQGVLIAWGTLAAYSLIVVTISSLCIKKMPRRQWRVLHYGSYVVLGLGLIHSLTISNEFSRYEPFRIEEPDKFLLAVVALPVVLLFPIWRIATAYRLRVKRAV
jgi:sulfoxide reductase heme-binding subunit YedZ